MASNSTPKHQNHQLVNDETQEKIKGVAKTNSGKKRGRPPKEQTTRELLYRKEDIITLPDSKIDVTFLQPGIPQKATFLEFMVVSVLPMVMNDMEIKALKKEELYTKVFTEFDKMLKEADEERQAGIIGMILMNHKGKQLMYELIIECFPGLDPTRLDDQVYIECFGVLITNFNESIFGVKA